MGWFNHHLVIVIIFVIGVHVGFPSFRMSSHSGSFQDAAISLQRCGTKSESRSLVVRSVAPNTTPGGTVVVVKVDELIMSSAKKTEGFEDVDFIFKGSDFQGSVLKYLGLYLSISC